MTEGHTTTVTPAESPALPDGREKERIIDEVLDLLARAAVTAIKGDSADYGPFPEGNEPK